jgi:acyl-coenzyme A synthetase/AMP-(fatty) acid ligase
VKSMYPYAPGWRVLMALSPQVQFSVSYILAALQAGATLLFVSKTTAEGLLEELHKYEPHQLIIGSGFAANFAKYLMRTRPGMDRVTPASVRIVCSGGSVLSSSIQEIIRARLAPEFYNHYGSSEAGLMARTTPGMQVKAPLLSGMLTPWMEGEAVDDEDNPLPHGTIGRLRFRGPGMSTGYIGDDEANARHFRDGWFYPGDLGGVTRQGFLALDGREDDRFSLGGMKYHPLAIEKILNTHSQVMESAITVGVVDDEPAIVALLVLGENANVQAVQAQLAALCKEHLGGSAPKAYLPVPSLPMSDGGKLKRTELPRLFESLTQPSS